jgi:hypothetical protein
MSTFRCSYVRSHRQSRRTQPPFLLACRARLLGIIIMLSYSSSPSHPPVRTSAPPHRCISPTPNTQYPTLFKPTNPRLRLERRVHSAHRPPPTTHHPPPPPTTHHPPPPSFPLLTPSAVAQSPLPLSTLLPPPSRPPHPSPPRHDPHPSNAPMHSNTPGPHLPNFLPSRC